MRARITQYVLIAIALIALFVILYKSGVMTKPVVFSDRDMMLSLWEDYKKDYIDPSSHRTIDRQRNEVTTSEGQSYTLLRAVWTADKETFDKSLLWTNKFLQRKDDALYSWLYGKRSDGTFGVLETEGGENTATDADTDIALALIFAYARWRDESYLKLAQNILHDIWNKAVITIDGIPYLTANNVEKTSSGEYAILNPSYFSPYAYRIFANVDPENSWAELIDSSYDVLNRSIDARLDKERSAGLPPDWIRINKSTGEIEAPVPSNDLTTNYSYDALRVPWRIALDHIWFGDPRAKSTLSKLNFLEQQWKNKKLLYGRYGHDGAVISTEEPVAMYGGSIGYFIINAPNEARAIYSSKLISNFDSNSGSWKKPLSYYDDNWAWFGMALYTGLLPNLAKDLQNGSSLETLGDRTSKLPF